MSNGYGIDRPQTHMLHTAALQMAFYLVASLILFPIICVVALGSRIFRASPSYECHSHVNFVTVDNVMTLPVPRLPTTQLHCQA